MQITIRLYLVLLLIASLSACYRLPMQPGYAGPPERPEDLLAYHSYRSSFAVHTEELLSEESAYTVSRIVLETDAGSTTIDHFNTGKNTAELIFVFPVLGGRPVISRHFAEYFARSGFDAAIVHRRDEFKEPERIKYLEEFIREGVIRDRNAIDYFEQEHGKRVFGSFGVSRGGINVAITAGVDSRLEHNVIALGGADLPGIFSDARERRLRQYLSTVSEQRGTSEEEVVEYLRNLIKSDPKYLARYIDANKTLMMLARCDTSVPLKYGELLRSEIGKPETIYFLAGHRTSGMFTQYFKLIPPIEDYCIFPPPYIELEALQFFRRAFDRGPRPLGLLPLRLLQMPLNVGAAVINLLGMHD